MAGTGHSYEVSNPGAARLAVISLVAQARSRDLAPAVDWLNTRHFLKYATGPAFTYELTAHHLLSATEAEEKDPRLLGKLASGGSVRRFTEEGLKTVGPDFSHIFDWIADLKRSGSRDYEKVARMSTEVVISKAREWTRRLAKRHDGARGETRPVLALADGLCWHELLDAAALAHEGAVMDHCVGGNGYTGQLHSGKSRIFSLRNEDGRSILTLELVRRDRLSTPAWIAWTLGQVQTKGNGGLPFSYCHHVIHILNEIVVADDLRAGSRYNLVRQDERRWTSVFDTWKSSLLHGHAVYTDGHQMLVSSRIDPSRPLFVLADDRRSSDWFGRDKVDATVSARDVGGLPPHYDDQTDAANFLNRLGVKRHYVGWLGIDVDRGILVPAVDLYEEFSVGGARAYKDDTGTVYVPHTSDRARLLMKFAKGSFRSAEAEVITEQRISRVEALNCLSLMTACEVRGFRRTNNISTTERGGDPTERFKDTYSPVLTEAGWRSFALDRTVLKAVRSEGEWLVAPYRIVYAAGRIERIEFSIAADGVTITGGYGWAMNPEHAREIARFLDRGGFVCHSPIVGNSYGPERSTVFLQGGGKWTWFDTPQRFRTVARRLLDRHEAGTKMSTRELSVLLAQARTHSKKDKRLLDVRRRALPHWFMAERQFGDLHVFPFSGVMFDADGDSLVERMCELHDAGFRVVDKKQAAQFRKAIAVINKRLGRGNFRYMLSTKGLPDLLFRWHALLERPFLNKAPLLLSSDFADESDKLARCLSVMTEPKAKSSKFMDRVVWLAQDLLRAANDYAAMPPAELMEHVRLYAALRRRCYLYETYLENVTKLRDAADAAIRSGQLGEEAVAVRKDMEDFIEYHAEQAAKRLAREMAA
jgi:hypothetical protein